jgi:N-acetyl sugar amidotransferase
MAREYQICNYCIMDTSDKDIVFDEQGVCNHCKSAKKILEDTQKAREEFHLEEYIEKVKKEGKNRKYDCIVGISGGVDSCYCIYLAKQWGLRPLAVHFDNGWNAELAVSNIKNILEKLDVDLYTYVVNWQEFRDLQLAFLKASTPDSEIPTDHMIKPVLGMVAHKYGVKTVWLGYNQTSESILPSSWSHGHRDWKYIKSVHKMYGTRELKTFPYFNHFDDIYFNLTVDWFSILDKIDYDKEKAKKLLEQEFGWRDYGGKHYESFYTRFYQSYILPVKFGYDKRRMHYSSLIVAGQITREEALRVMEQPPYDPETIERDIEYFLEKMEITREEFDEIMARPKKSFWDYPSDEKGLLGRLEKRVYSWKIKRTD